MVSVVPSGRAKRDRGHAAVAMCVEIGRRRARHDVDAEPPRGGEQRALELLAGAVRRAVHAQHRVARVEEALDELELDAVAVGEPLDRRSRGPRDGVDDPAVGRALRLAPDVRGEELRRILDAERALEARTGGGDEGGRERGAAGGLGVPLEHQHLRAGLAHRQRGRQAARAGPDNDDGRPHTRTSPLPPAAPPPSPLQSSTPSIRGLQAAGTSRRTSCATISSRAFLRYAAKAGSRYRAARRRSRSPASA